ncbi:hypothetical protein DXG01_001013 [Tephrocybe rancida]|nr:hypothetical protein DXG01_001013 [Tephrocybe rancida]
MSSTKDYVNAFNTVGQYHNKKITYEYSSTGAQNDITWTAKVYLGEELYGEGKPQKTKRHAQASAAQAAVETYERGA